MSPPNEKITSLVIPIKNILNKLQTVIEQIHILLFLRSLANRISLNNFTS